MRTVAAVAAAGFLATQAWAATLLNVSYDVTREFYTDYNPLFLAHWKAGGGGELKIEQSHGGSSKQARAVIDGLEADVVTMNQETDIDSISRAGLLPADWKSLLPDDSAPYESTIVFLVRKGNPKGITDWGDLARSDVGVILPNPKTSGNGRYGYLAALAWAQRKFGTDEAAVRDYLTRFIKNIPVLETGGRAATNTFVQKGLGDVLLTFESETLQIARVFDPGSYDIVYPSLSIAADAPVAVVSEIARRRGTTEVATAYLKHLWSDEGQRLAAKHFFRPKSPAILAEYSSIFPRIELVRVSDAFGSWSAAQKAHFDDGGSFDRIYEAR